MTKFLAQSKQVSPFLITNIFSLYLTFLRTEKIQCYALNSILCCLLTEVYTIEFQKRGLPLAHILLWLDQVHQINGPAKIDNIIAAEIPEKNDDSHLHKLVGKFMNHGPCNNSSNVVSLKDKHCSKYFPRKFVDVTLI